MKGLLFDIVINGVRSLKIPYFIYGAVASGIYGRPRFTSDIDLVIYADKKNAERFLAWLKNNDIRIGEEKIQAFMKGDIVGFRIGEDVVDISLGMTAFDKSAIKRARTIKFNNYNIQLVSPEDLIIYKVVSYLYFDREDAVAVLKRQRDKLDFAYMKKWTKKFGKEIYQRLLDIIKDADKS